MLAYVFWHWIGKDTGTEGYEERLLDFHRTLAANKPTGFNDSTVFKIKHAPWANDGGDAYQDWYRVANSAALDPLNETAVNGARKDPHDTVAQMTRAGAGGLYRLRSGTSEVHGVCVALWLTKPKGFRYEAFYELIEPMVAAQAGASLWRRQMVLGPAPEFCLFAPASLDLLLDFQPLGVPMELLWTGE